MRDESIGIQVDTHDVDELNEGQAELDVDGVGHVLHGSYELVVAPEQISHQPLLILGAESFNRGGILE